MVSVAICTWNRAPLLDQTLEGMRALRIPDESRWELLIVNNNCSDTTDEVIEKHSGYLPIRRIFEPEQGQSRARNRALEESASDWLIFTDDDVLVEPGLLEAYLGAISECGEDVAFLGGVIEPWFAQSPDPDLVRAMPSVANGFCGVSEEKMIALGSLMVEQGGTLPAGANFAIARRRIAGNRFDERLGLKGRGRVVGEETEFLLRLLDLGMSGRWVPEARLRHYVAPGRLTLPRLRRHLFDLGRTHVLLYGSLPGRRFLNTPRWIWRKSAEDLAKTAFFKFTKNKYKYFKLINDLYIQLGMIYQGLVGPAGISRTTCGLAPGPPRTGSGGG